jgi:hypothetical protein
MVLDAKCSQWPLLDTDASIVVGLLPRPVGYSPMFYRHRPRGDGRTGSAVGNSAALLEADGRLILETRQNLARR